MLGVAGACDDEPGVAGACDDELGADVLGVAGACDDVLDAAGACDDVLGVVGVTKLKYFLATVFASARGVEVMAASPDGRGDDEVMSASPDGGVDCFSNGFLTVCMS